MPNVVGTNGDSLPLTETILVENTNFKPIYGSVEGADRYFSEQLYGQLWEVTPLDKRLKALITATRNIDSLRFAGRKTEPTQPLEFPRNGETTNPQCLQYAVYEEALALLKGAETDTEFAGIFVSSRVFGKVRTDYDFRTAPEHVVAGIASHRAWIHLKPLLVQGKGIKLRRVS